MFVQALLAKTEVEGFNQSVVSGFPGSVEVLLTMVSAPPLIATAWTVAASPI